MHKIDVHHHFIGPDYLEAWNACSISSRVKLPEWSPELSLAFMEKYDISHAVLSPALPPDFVCMDGATCADLARRMNEYAASLCSQHPEKFSFFATLSDPGDAQRSIKELVYACDELGANGVCLFTSYQGRYLGDKAFSGLWAELDRRAIVVFVHPGMDFADQLVREPVLIPRPLIDWTHETTRTATHLILSNVMRNHTRCSVILPHGGGTLPYVVQRLATLSTTLGMTDKTREEIVQESQRFYFDLAFAGFDGSLALLKQFALPGHLLFGSDFPYGRSDDIYGPQIARIEQEETEVCAEIRLGAIQRLLPYLKRT